MIGAVMMGNTRRCCTDLELRSREGFGSHPRFEPMRIAPASVELTIRICHERYSPVRPCP